MENICLSAYREFGCNFFSGPANSNCLNAYYYTCYNCPAGSVVSPPNQCKCSYGFLTNSPNCKLSTDCPDYADGIGLLKFKNGLTYSKPGSFANWNANLPNPCLAPAGKRWAGVSCSSYTCGGRVTSLILASRNLTGNITAEAFKTVTYLKVLNLTKNSLNGVIPYYTMLVCNKPNSVVNFRCNAFTSVSSPCLTKSPNQACEAINCPRGYKPATNNKPVGQCDRYNCSRPANTASINYTVASCPKTILGDANCVAACSKGYTFTKGSLTRKCNGATGILSIQNITCSDVNECSTNKGGCGIAANFTCTNSVGSYSCGCTSGYIGTYPNCKK